MTSHNNTLQALSVFITGATLSAAAFCIVMLNLTAPTGAQAKNMDSDSYSIQFGNFNVTSGQKDSDSFNVTDTVGQTAAGPYGEYGNSSFFVGSGFQYIYQIPQFRFSISKLLINLGELTPGTHNTDDHTITITTQGAGGYTVYVHQQHPLRHQNGTTEIPNTSCDSGCTISAASIWTNQNNPGFGFGVTGDDVTLDFIDQNYFRPFANRELAQASQPIMQSSNIANQRQATVNYKAGVVGDQATGAYEAAVVFVAVPGY